ncbi:MAG: glycosyltransferase family 39 protein [Desulfovibrio sp.]
MTRLFTSLPPARRHALICALLALAFCLLHGLKIDDSGVGGDAREFLSTAYHLQRHGVFSMQLSPEMPSIPDAYRPPVYPFLLAGIIEAVPGLRADAFGWLYAPESSGLPENHGPRDLKVIKYVQMLLYLAAAFAAMWIVARITGDRRWGYGAFVLTMLHPFLGSYVNRYYSELVAAVLLAGFSLLFYQAVRLRSMGWFLTAGLCLGVLVLTRAQWWYCGPACALYAMFVGVLRRRERKTRGRLIVGALLMCLTMAIVVTPWKMRNQELFGRNFITERAGIALDLRSQYVMMSNDEILASFLYWTRMRELRDELLPRLMDPARYRNLVREVGYYNTALRRSGELEKLYPRSVADEIQFREAAERILSHPWNYLKTLPALTYRGMIDGNLSVLNLLIWFACFRVVFGLMRRGDWETLAVYAPLMAMWGFDSLVTHNITRYNSTGSVLLMVALAHCLWLCQQARIERAAARAASPLNAPQPSRFR